LRPENLYTSFYNQIMTKNGDPEVGKDVYNPFRFVFVLFNGVGL